MVGISTGEPQPCKDKAKLRKGRARTSSAIGWYSVADRERAKAEQIEKFRAALARRKGREART